MIRFKIAIWLFIICFLFCVGIANATNLKVMKIWGKTQRPWGYEIRIDYKDLDTGQIYNEEIVFKKKPDEAQLNNAILKRKNRLKKMISETPSEPEKVYTESEVTSILVKKGYLNEGQKFEDLPYKKTGEVAR